MNKLLPVEAALYNNRNVQKGTYYHGCIANDLISKIDEPLRQFGFHLTFDGTYKKKDHPVSVNSPWQHVNHLHTKRCVMDNGIKFNVLKYIPPRCQECWKVVVTPRTLKELFLLIEVEKDLDRASKAGIEMRWYTDKFYGGYFYNNSLDEGRERYEEVRKAVSEHISPDVPIILKRACTEYELTLGPSAAWHMTDAQWKMDEEFDAIVDHLPPVVKGQTKFVIHSIHSNWIEWAWKHKDPTVKEYIGDLPLYPPAMTYHEGDIDEIKKDIIKARAKAKYNIDPNTVDAVHGVLGGFKLTKQIGMKQMGAITGLDNINPLYIGEGIEIG